MHVTLADAEIAIVSASKRAAELETKMCIAIVDSGANLKAFHRMDDAWVGSVDIAIKKAKTAVFFWYAHWPDRQAVAARRFALRNRTFDEGVITFPGDYPSSTRKAF